MLIVSAIYETSISRALSHCHMGAMALMRTHITPPREPNQFCSLICDDLSAECPFRDNAAKMDCTVCHCLRCHEFSNECEAAAEVHSSAAFNRSWAGGGRGKPSILYVLSDIAFYSNDLSKLSACLEVPRPRSCFCHLRIPILLRVCNDSSRRLGYGR